MTVSGLPFDDIRALFEDLPGPAGQMRELVCQRNTNLYGSAQTPGRLAQIQVWLAEWSGVSPVVNRPMVAIFAGTHGASDEEDRKVAAQKVSHIAAGGAAVNQICGANDLGLKVFDLALPYPVGDIASSDALDEKSCAATIAFGMEAVAGGIDLLCLGDCSGPGIGSAATLFAALHGGKAADWCADRAICALVDHALARAGDVADPLELLRRLGGRETSAIVGAILAARTQHIPVILEGETALAAAAVLEAACPGATAHCMCAQEGHSPQRRRMLEALKMQAILDFGSQIEDGANAALAAVVARLAALIHTGSKAAGEDETV